MSPASYLTAPPRVAASIVAPCRHESPAPSSERGRSGSVRGSRAGGARPASEPLGDPEAEAHHEHPGEGVEDEVVARDDDRQDDRDRVGDADELPEKRAGIEHQA